MSGDHPTGAVEFEGETWMYLCRGIVRDGEPGGPVEGVQLWFSVPGESGEWLASRELPPEELDLSRGALRALLAELAASARLDSEGPQGGGTGR